MKTTKVFAASLLFLLTPHLVQAQSLPVDPRKNWRVLETQHFEIIYDETTRPLADKFAAEAERADRLLQPFMKTPMPSRVPIVIADITDQSNGFATGIPRPTIEIYPVLPAVTDSTSEYADWVREVVTHEYTHILMFEPTSGVPGVFRFLLGSIMKPNMLLPRWYAEGMAVEMESRLTPVGRGRSHYYQSLVRAMVEEGTWSKEELAQINFTGIPTWPRGQRPYTLGYFLMHELMERPYSTPLTIDPHEPRYSLLNHRHGGRIPYFLDGVAKDYWGLDYFELLNDMYKKTQKKVDEQIAELHAAGAKNGEVFYRGSPAVFGPQISPDGLKLAAISNELNSDPAVILWTRKSTGDAFDPATKKIITTQTDIRQLSWRADSRHIVYDYLGTYKNYSKFQDLYDLDIETGDDAPLTEGFRAREATVLQDGRLVFIRATSTNTQLWLSDEQGKNPELLLDPPMGHRLSAPRTLKDAVIYSHRDNNGREWIEKLSIGYKAVTPLTSATKALTYQVMPAPETPSSTNFFYSSTENGSFNIYHFKDGKSEPVTLTTTSASGVCFDSYRNEIYYSRLTSTGFALERASVAKAPVAPKLAALQNYPEADESAAPPAEIKSEKPYRGFRYLFPQFWLPSVYFVPGGTQASASISGADPLNHHLYAAELGIDSRVGAPREYLAYSYGGLPFLINAGISNDYFYIYGTGQSAHYLFGSVSTRHFIFSDSNKWSLSPEFTYRQTEPTGFSFTQGGPGLLLSYNGLSAIKDYQVSPESGIAFNLGYDYYPSSIGNTSYGNIRADFASYVSGGFLPERHVFAFKAAAWVAPWQQTIYTGTQYAGGEYGASLYQNPYVVRGYPFAEFLAYTMYVANVEYRFPIAYPFRGSTAPPIFFDKISGALVADAITLDGGYYDSINPGLWATHLGTFYASAGAELRADTQLLYGFPFTFKLGVYYGFTQKAYGGVSEFLGLSSNL